MRGAPQNASAQETTKRPSPSTRFLSPSSGPCHFSTNVRSVVGPSAQGGTPRVAGKRVSGITSPAGGADEQSYRGKRDGAGVANLPRAGGSARRLGIRAGSLAAGG